MHLCQAEVIVDSLKDLSAEVGPEQRAGGEAILIAECATLDPAGLGQLGRRLEELLDPEACRPATRPRSGSTSSARSANASSP